jgi:hypothetical protein
MNKAVMLIYSYSLWKDHIPNQDTIQPNIAHSVREKYITPYIVLSHIGVIGMVQKRNLFV